MQKYKNLLMDLDGTLIDSGSKFIPLKFISGVLPQMKKHKGWTAAFQALKESSRILKYPSTEKTNLRRMVEVYQKHLGLPYGEAEKHLSEAIAKTFPKLEPHFGEIRGAQQFIEWAKDRHTLTLTTNPVWPREIVEMRMRWGKINPDDFKSITTADRMHACKPSREYYEEVLKQEGFKPEDCLMVGNERKMDLPATRAGIAVFLIRPDAREMTNIQMPGAIIDGRPSPGAWRGTYDHLINFLIKQG